MQKKQFYDGGGFPLFTSYHDYRLPMTLVGPLHTDHVQFREAFRDLVKSLRQDPAWRRNFDATQIRAIEAAMATNGPRIKGFVWHHHQDHGILQLVSEADHRRIHHYGGRFTTGGRPGRPPDF